MQRSQATVVERRFRGARGETPIVMYGVHVHVLPGHDEMWEALTHAAVFTDVARAERLAERINAAVGKDLNWAHWVFPGHACSPIAATNVGYYSPL